jgi:diguanylate cyclase (GGDEF)-like protein
MRFVLPKNRTAPLILFAIFGVLVSLTLGLYHMERMAKYSIKSTLETFDSLTDNTSAFIRQEIENNYQSIKVSADLVGKSGTLSKEQIISLLPILAEDKSYIDMAIVNMDGMGYNSSGETVDVSNEPYFQDAKDGHVNVSDSISYTKDHEPVVIYAAPIKERNAYNGVLLGTVSAKLENLGYLENDSEKDSVIYILNQKNDLISYLNAKDSSDFNYNDIVEHGVFYDNYKTSISGLHFTDYFIKQKEENKSYVWDQKPLGLNHWSVLIGRTDIVSPITIDILRFTNTKWIYITISTFCFFLLLIISERRSNRKMIQVLYLDPVTGGSNWYKFRIDVNKILNSKNFNKRQYALINFDINRFKIINDSYGYQKGDEVLKDIYMVIKKWANLGEPFTRYAADQFYILLSYHEETEVIDRINQLNEDLHQLRYTKTAKIYFGIYYITERKDSIDRMGEFAGIAKNNIKGNNESIISFFDDVARGKLLEEEEIEKSMYDALKHEEFEVYLQPKYAAREETISGAEALVRWCNHNGTMISPSYFIPVFEKNGFIAELDFYMLRKVCRLLRSWLDQGYSPLPISVNISRIHFANIHLADMIKEIVDNYMVPHSLIELELTESAFLQSKQTLVRTVNNLRKYGFLVSMDDFGAGYSSLNSLKDLPLDVVKLDGELFRISDQVERGLTVIRNTIMMAKDLHMTVVAECIETKEQVEFLCTVGCDIIQGYYYARPMPVEQFERKYLKLVE